MHPEFLFLDEPLASSDEERRIPKRIEAAIVNLLRGHPGLVGEFQNGDIRYHPRRADEEPISVEMKSYEDILGLCAELTAQCLNV